MEFDKLNKSLTLVANFGVIVGIIFLVVEIRQNTTISRAHTRAQQTVSVLTLQQMESNPDLLDAYEKVAAGRPLRFRDQFVLALIANANFRHWENSYYQRQEGQFAEDEFMAEAATIRNLLAEQNHWEYWACSRQTYSQEFRDFVDSLADFPSCADDYALGALSRPYVIADGESRSEESEE